LFFFFKETLSLFDANITDTIFRTHKYYIETSSQKVHIQW